VTDALTGVPLPVNEPIHGYAPGSAERASLGARIESLVAAGPVEITATIGGEQVAGTGPVRDVVSPHQHSRVLGHAAAVGPEQAKAAVAATREAAPGWRSLSIDDRAAVFLRAAALLSGPWRDTLNAATMLGQSKSVQQAEIDSACELADFWRFNVAFARQLYAEQPVANSTGVWNTLDHRPLEGFVYAISPFNFTAIGGNLATAPALMGNTVIWKPSPTQGLAAHFTMRLLEEAGLPPGVINLLPGDGPEISEVLLADPDLAGIHFTGSTATFRSLWRGVADNLDTYRSYPRLVGETGGKDFVLVLPDADVDVARTALVLGSFEYSGQKCSASSRAYVPASLWPKLRDSLAAATEALTVGDVTGDLSIFTGAVIDDRAFAKQQAVFDRVKSVDSISVLAGGTADDSVGWFVRPTILVGTDPTDEVFTTEYFGPVLALHVYDDADLDSVVHGIDTLTPYGLTGAVIGRDRAQLAAMTERLRFAAGNFYINDKSTGAVVGQQPFGGARSSGTDDKAGAASNLMRWTATRAIKENLDPPRTISYPHVG
jgi:1-pyrroline-5-carboxylate dehydrogenase